MSDKGYKLSKLALSKSYILQNLINTLNNTTVGSLSNDIGNIQTELTTLNTRIVNFASLFGVVFNPDGTITSEDYTTHKHNYKDKTINDTDDGTGVETDTTRETLGVN